jgi:uncharacterized membrane protein
MMEYIIIKWLHVLSSTILFGTGIGSAFYLFFASRGKDPRVLAFVIRHVVIADWVFTATTIVVQPATGIYLAHLANIPLETRWIFWSFVLYVIAGACWLPVVWMQLRMRDLARVACDTDGILPPRYWILFRCWVLLGIPAFLALALIFYLMIAKPV